MAAWDELMLSKLLVRYADLVPDGAAFMANPEVASADPREVSIVDETTAHRVERSGPAGFPRDLAVVGLRQSVGGAAAPKFSAVAEAVIAHIGRWRIALGPNGENAHVDLQPGDVVSVPAGTYRRLEKLDDAPGFLFIVRGSGVESAATVVSAVFACSLEAAPHLLTGGRWIDTSDGLPVLKEAARDAEVTAAAMASPEVPGGGALCDCVAFATTLAANPGSPLAANGVEEAAVIAPRPTRDRFSPGPIKGWWPHGFSLRYLTLTSGGYVPMHSRGEWEILLLQEGTLEVSWADGEVMMGAGDTLTVPTGRVHALRNTTSGRTRVFAVRGSEDPAMPLFQSMPLHA